MRGRDPALRVTVLLLWGLLALFVLYPLLSLLGRVATDGEQQLWVRDRLTFALEQLDRRSSSPPDRHPSRSISL